MEPSETPLEQAGRHLRQALNRVAEQQGTVRRLERGGPSQELDDAEAALAQMLDFRMLANDRFGQEIAREKPIG